ncbi:hypothetical protein ACVOMV_34430 [Mesorhizobium atlanticum]
MRPAVVGIELLAAAQGCDFHAPLASSEALEAVRKLVRAEVPHLDNDRHFHPDMEKAIAMHAQRCHREGGERGGAAVDCRSGMMTSPPGLTVTKGAAPLLVSIPHTGIDLAGLDSRLVSTWLRPARLRLVDRQAL